MLFEWDEEKNKANIRKHGIDFNDACQAFSGPMLQKLDTRQDYGEDRWVGIGYLSRFVAVVVYVEKKQETIRIISARKATSNERQRFEKEIKNRLG